MDANSAAVVYEFPKDLGINTLREPEHYSWAIREICIW